jgi:RNA polymerase sigma-70 factor (ECF subfamily)
MRDDEFEQLFDAEAAGLLNYLTLRVGDRSTAEDLAADAFERAFRSRWRFDRRRGSQKTWLYGIALNTLTDHRRRQQAEAKAMERSHQDDALVDAFSSSESRDEVHRALVVLSSEERQVIALRYGADLPLGAIAALIDEPLTTVEGRVYRALRKLRTALAAVSA